MIFVPLINNERVKVSPRVQGITEASKSNVFQALNFRIAKWTLFIVKQVSFDTDLARLVLARHKLSVLFCSAAYLTQILVLEFVLVDELASHDYGCLSVVVLEFFKIFFRAVEHLILSLAVHVVLSFFFANEQLKFLQHLIVAPNKGMFALRSLSLKFGPHGLSKFVENL